WLMVALGDVQWRRGVGPGLAIRPLEHCGGLPVSDDVFLLRSPLDLSSQAQGNIGQVAGGRHTVAGLDIGNRCRAGFDAVEEIPRVRSQQIVGRGMLDRKSVV